MAEERILCIETCEKIAECGYGDFYNTITRTEAIERIAKEMYKEVWPKMRYSKFDKERFSKLAESALNALLRSDYD